MKSSLHGMQTTIWGNTLRTYPCYSLEHITNLNSFLSTGTKPGARLPLFFVSVMDCREIGLLNVCRAYFFLLDSVFRQQDFKHIKRGYWMEKKFKKSSPKVLQNHKEHISSSSFVVICNSEISYFIQFINSRLCRRVAQLCDQLLVCRSMIP